MQFLLIWYKNTAFSRKFLSDLLPAPEAVSGAKPDYCRTQAPYRTVPYLYDNTSMFACKSPCYFVIVISPLAETETNTVIQNLHLDCWSLASIRALCRRPPLCPGQSKMVIIEPQARQARQERRERVSFMFRIPPHHNNIAKVIQFSPTHASFSTPGLVSHFQQLSPGFDTGRVCIKIPAIWEGI